MSANADQDYFRVLFDHLGFICITVDRELVIREWNRQAMRHFGQTAEQVRGRSVLEILEEPDRAQAELMVRQAMGGAHPVEHEVHYGAGVERRTLVMIISPIVDAGGRSESVSISMRDISERKRLSQELARSRRMDSLGTMAEGIVDHFNNIFAGMLTSIECVLASDSVRELRSTLRSLGESIDRAGRIIRRLANFAESQQERMDFVDLNELMVQFDDHLRRLARKLPIELDIRIEPLAPAAYERQRVLPALESVAQNALDAMPDGGTLSINVAQEGQEAVIRIADTGCGMTEEQTDHLYEPFYTTKGVRGGGERAENIGLGLAAVHGMVAELGGTIRIDSKLGKGTCVIIRLPLDRSPPAGPQ